MPVGLGLVMLFLASLPSYWMAQLDQHNKQRKK